jgi:hypothetical protein
MATKSPLDLDQRLDRIYSAIANEEDARVCREISDEACRVVPSSFFLQMAALTATKLGDAVANAKTTLAWVLSFVGAPTAMVAFLVPIRESGSLLPQLVIASFVRRMPVRKWVWVTGSVLQCAALGAIALVAATMRGGAAGLAVLALLVVFSLARGLSSVAAKDVLGKTVPKTRRGRLGGITASVSGALVMVVGLLMLARRGEPASAEFYGWLLAGAAALWLLAAGTYALIREYPGETEGGGDALREALRRLALLREDRAFREFVVTRSLLLCSALSAPYFVVVAQDRLGGELSVLGTFILAGGLAQSLSAPFWGRWADSSSRDVMTAAALVTAAVGLAFAAIVHFVPALRDAIWLYPLAYFVLGVAHSGVRLGRKTYLVDLAGGNKRTDYVAVSNSVIGAVLLAMGALGALASAWSALGVIVLLSVLGLTGAIFSRRLPQVE